MPARNTPACEVVGSVRSTLNLHLGTKHPVCFARMKRGIVPAKHVRYKLLYLSF
jgi:hypothetical protein